MIILPGAAKNAPSMARIAILTASLAYLNHTCCKFGKSCPTWRISGSAKLATPKAIKEFQSPIQKRPETSVFGLERLVENRGIEPLTSGLQSPRSPS